MGVGVRQRRDASPTPSITPAGVWGWGHRQREAETTGFLYCLCEGTAGAAAAGTAEKKALSNGTGGGWAEPPPSICQFARAWKGRGAGPRTPPTPGRRRDLRPAARPRAGTIEPRPPLWGRGLRQAKVKGSKGKGSRAPPAGANQLVGDSAGLAQSLAALGDGVPLSTAPHGQWAIGKWRKCGGCVQHTVKGTARSWPGEERTGRGQVWGGE